VIWLRSALFNVLFFVIYSSAMVVSVLIFPLPADRHIAFIRLCVRAVLWLLRSIVGLDWELRGDAASFNGATIVASKHQSAWDTMIFYLIAPRPSYVLKRELLRIPLFGWALRRHATIAIDREGRAASMRHLLRSAGQAIASGRQVIIFPEGTRVAPGQTRAYHPGVAALYTHLKCPVVPVALNSGLFWGRRSFVKRPGRIIVEILPPIAPGLPRHDFAALLERRIESATRRLETDAGGA
jgi:1-acyl-sn-glycerol-3-phosphate acyltransferase